MDDILSIKWSKSHGTDTNGCMNIELNAFFPSPVRRLRKLLKLMRKYSYDNDIVALREYLVNKIRENEQEIKLVSNHPYARTKLIKGLNRRHNELCRNIEVINKFLE